MAIDAYIKRGFPGIVLALIALAAYFQAGGLMALVGAGLVESDEGALARWEPASGKQTGALGRKSASAIISRNPFDSVTGPLDRRDEPGGELGVESPVAGGPADLSDPLNVARCDGVIVHIVTESTDPTWSLALVQAPGEPKGRLARVGDAVGEKKIAYIGFNPVKASPSVWLEGPGSLCQALLFAPPAPSPAAQPKPATGVAKSEPAAKPGAGVPKEIADKIQKVNDTEFHVDRQVVDNILENQADLMKSARIVPEKKDGKVVGIRLFGIRPDTLLGKLGMQNGDRLESINGFDMASPEKALEAYARLRTAEGLNVKITRRGTPMTLDYRIK
jgi:general secretion pathway protein C